MGEKEAVVPEVVGRSRGMPELSAEPKVAGSRVPEAELSTEPFDVPAAEAPAMTTSDGERDAAGQGMPQVGSTSTASSDAMISFVRSVGYANSQRGTRMNSAVASSCAEAMISAAISGLAG